MVADWIAHTLAAGLTADVLDLDLQPVVSLDTGAVVGAEGFIRWRHPEHGVVPAGTWIPHAEATGAIVDCALAMVPTWASLSGPGKPVISLNLGGRQLLDGRFLTALADIARPVAVGLAVEVPYLQFFPEEANRVAPAWPWAEIDDLPERLAALQEHGFGVWLDDFGAGLTDEGPLGCPGVDLVKLDRSLLTRPWSWLAALVDRIRDHGKQVVIEGIENADHVETARRAGIALGQGHHFSPPVTVDLFVAAHGRVDPEPGARTPDGNA